MWFDVYIGQLTPTQKWGGSYNKHSIAFDQTLSFRKRAGPARLDQTLMEADILPNKWPCGANRTLFDIDARGTLSSPDPNQGRQ